MILTAITLVMLYKLPNIKNMLDKYGSSQDNDITKLIKNVNVSKIIILKADVLNVIIELIHYQ